MQQYARVASKIGVDPAAMLFETNRNKNAVRFAAALILQQDEEAAEAKRKAEQNARRSI
ncbi:hypothetical protein BARRETLEMON_18 [Arthrobacter phage BarretLemon]|uniref:Uncharacterized protein n=4 Tax=Marthavirus barretlemon TaxID=2560300 RepID=A0A386KNI3_9CAUD|nr:hypothetical protein BJD79_gp18 [Arthrobacter phage BarretLemon]AMM44480.1 hypothetical protein BARRETLEMON_18 [Arthrobacter phage BarretLemon]ASR78048.1 hypothetical protein SEA_TIMINATOR_18 [Arthrobacter phage Timinator]AYD86489.1 hypothetical protein SEA_LEEROYJ_18 [Arthrobacter phage LeeroyJ]QJD53348.1 hypothetical protein SEA_STEVIEBAY_18 [Arthrobacter phage StevieBAY]